MERSSKRRKIAKGKSGIHSGEERGEVVAIELQWTGGERENDHLHQIIQFLGNKMNTTDFNLIHQTETSKNI